MKRITVLIFAIALMFPLSSFAAMKAPGVLDNEEIITEAPLTGYKAVGIRFFSTDDVEYENVDKEEMRKMKREMKENQRLLARTIRNNLQAADIEAFIIEDDGKGADRADMIVEGRFVNVNLGSAAVRFMFGFGAGQIGVATEGSLVNARTGEPLARFGHETTSGLDDRFNKWQMLNNEVDDMGDDISEFVEKLM